MSGIDCYRMTESPAERELRRRIRREAIMEWIGGGVAGRTGRCLLRAVGDFHAAAVERDQRPGGGG